MALQFVSLLIFRTLLVHSLSRFIKLAIISVMIHSSLYIQLQYNKNASHLLTVLEKEISIFSQFKEYPVIGWTSLCILILSCYKMILHLMMRNDTHELATIMKS